MQAHFVVKKLALHLHGFKFSPTMQYFGKVSSNKALD